MTKQIHILPPLVANLIAAGEVIERPASVVKELLENSLDAKANRIQIDIEKGGLQLIRVRDDGIGMSKEDLMMAPQRHATSKIRTAEDLEKIVSLGIRGEALASIDSVAPLSITSLAEGEQTAWKLYRPAYGQEYILEPAAHPRGTTVEVSELFCYAPVRRKFLRSDKTEYLYLEEVVKRVMLSTFDVSFVLRHNQRLVAQVRAGKSELEQDKRIATICGNPFLKNSLRIDSQYEGMQLWGWLGLPSFHRSQSDLQYIYINGRMVKDKLLNHAIRAAYLDSIEEGRYPCYVLYLTIATDTIDVNVHPTKQEVRFTDSRLVHEWLVMTLRQTLQDALSVKVMVDGEEWPSAPADRIVSVNTMTDTVAINTEQDNLPQGSVVEDRTTHHYFQKKNDIHFAQYSAPSALSQELIWLQDNPHKQDAILGIFHQHYALLRREDHVGWLDLKALQCQTICNKIMSAWQGEPLKAQWLLLPQTYPFKGYQPMARLLLQKKLAPLGIAFDWEEDILTVRQAPALLRDLLNRSLFSAWLTIPLSEEDNHALWLQALVKNITFAESFFKKMSLDAIHKLWLEAAGLNETNQYIRWVQLEDIKREQCYADQI